MGEVERWEAGGQSGAGDKSPGEAGGVGWTEKRNRKRRDRSPRELPAGAAQPQTVRTHSAPATASLIRVGVR